MSGGTQKMIHKWLLGIFILTWPCAPYWVHILTFYCIHCGCLILHAVLCQYPCWKKRLCFYTFLFSGLALEKRIPESCIMCLRQHSSAVTQGNSTVSRNQCELSMWGQISVVLCFLCVCDQIVSIHLSCQLMTGYCPSLWDLWPLRCRGVLLTWPQMQSDLWTQQKKSLKDYFTHRELVV